MTFVFTDIEGSTRLLKQVGSSYGEILACHKLLVRTAIEEHDGCEIDTQGEAFFVAFRRAKDAVAATIDIQLSHSAEQWQDDVEVRVRVGIHTAEPGLSADGYFGMGVHRAARICSVGHGRQILLSRSAAGLADEDELPGIRLYDLGEHQLKDLDRPERIYQLRAAGLQSDFPPLRSLSELARSADDPRLPTGTVTFFVTDLVGSVALLREYGSRSYGNLLDTYESVLREAVANRGGKVFEMVGDSLVAVFPRARDAVVAGIRATNGLARATWPNGRSPGVRIGLHTGEADRWKSGYVGLGLVRALRVCGAADGGQVLASPTTESVVDQSSLDGASLRALDEQLLEDFERPVVLYEVLSG